MRVCRPSLPDTGGCLAGRYCILERDLSGCRRCVVSLGSFLNCSKKSRVQDSEAFMMLSGAKTPNVLEAAASLGSGTADCARAASEHSCCCCFE